MHKRQALMSIIGVLILSFFIVLFQAFVESVVQTHSLEAQTSTSVNQSE